ncbi:MAG: hypothetical protein MRK02_02670 [Candidatus Scalindua sp.]|nr:hypothetical protein [Candidatus Scalindua sp.]
MIKSSPFGAFKYDFKDEAEAYAGSKVVVVGVPYDGTTTFQTRRQKRAKQYLTRLSKP